MTAQSASRAGGLPDDILSLSHADFYDFVEREYGFDLAELFRFQSIRNGIHLLDASSNDVLSIFSQDSVELNELKKMCCFQVVGNKYEVKLGVKLAIRNLIQSLKVKYDQQRKKTSSYTSIIYSVDQH